jgi:hypothetical protein
MNVLRHETSQTGLTIPILRSTCRRFNSSDPRSSVVRAVVSIPPIRSIATIQDPTRPATTNIRMASSLPEELVQEILVHLPPWWAPAPSTRQPSLQGLASRPLWPGLLPAPLPRDPWSDAAARLHPDSGGPRIRRRLGPHFSHRQGAGDCP